MIVSNTRRHWIVYVVDGREFDPVNVGYIVPPAGGITSARPVKPDVWGVVGTFVPELEKTLLNGCALEC